ncbi:YuzD family protein [Peribacillus alkalitolerans]|uniref:YuzD family protein n=1 Tax=Peribacillus alkalitolerans TaxID=1550385 RepID=UPI0013D2506E|nr:YuzD family protein [Peribacillus alkalitolerans]
MVNEQLEIEVYGTEVVCPSCVNLPSSIETYEWLQAALSRKFPEQPFSISYIDIHKEQQHPGKAEFAKRVIEEDLFYPVVVINGKIVGEGNPKLKTVAAEMEKYGYKA